MSNIYEAPETNPHVLKGAEWLLESDAMSPNDESPDWYYVHSDNVEYLVKTVIQAVAQDLRADALRTAADAIQELHPGEVKASVTFLRARAEAMTRMPTIHFIEESA